MNTSSQFNDNRVFSAPFQAAQFYQDSVGVKSLKASDYVYHTSNYTPIRSLGVSYRNAPGLRGGNSGMFPSERNTQAFALAASNVSTADYRTMMASSNAESIACDMIMRRLVDLKLKIDVAVTDDQRAVAKQNYEKELQNAYQNSCALP